MAYNQNGQYYTGQYSQYQTPPEQQGQYGAYQPPPAGTHLQQPPNPHNLRRPSSFEAGDDRRYGDQGNASRPGLPSRPDEHIRMPNQEHYIQNTGFVGRAHSHSVSAGPGYPYNTSPNLNTTSQQSPHATYNPQQYARTNSQSSAIDTQYITQPYNAPQVTSPSTMYQPYIPAAYHPSSPPLPPSHGFQSHDQQPSTQQNTSPYVGYGPGSTATPVHQNTSPYLGSSQGSAPASAAYEHSFGRRQSYSSHVPQYQTQHHPSMVSPQISSSPNPSYHNAYTPPAPPPPPLSPTPEQQRAQQQQAPQHHQIPPNRAYSQLINTTQASVAPNPGSNQARLSHRLPALPVYEGSGDYVTTSPDPHRQSISPRLSSGYSAPSPPAQPLQQSPQRANTSGRHPQSRPLPAQPDPTPPTTQGGQDYFGHSNGGQRPPGTGPGSDPQSTGYDDLMKELDDAVMARAPSASGRGQSPRMGRLPPPPQGRIHEEIEPQPLFAGSNRTSVSPDTRYTHTNGAGMAGGSLDVSYIDSDDSDAEAAAGLAAMQMADEQEARDLAYRTHSNLHSRNISAQSSQPPIPEGGTSSDSDVHFDMDTYGGGFPAQVQYHYGGETHLSANAGLARNPSSSASLQRSDVSSENLAMPAGNYMMAGEDMIHPFPTFGARTDTGGTGGLAEPGAHNRRLSFEDGDEATLVDPNDHQASSGSNSIRDSIRSSGSYPSRSGSRPLPQIPGTSGSNYYAARRQTDQYGRPIYPQAPEEYDTYTPRGSVVVQKANSIGSPPVTTPLVVPPGRSITDAEQRRRHQLNTHQRVSSGYDASMTPDTATLDSAKLGDIVLPTIPAGKRRKFVPSKLSSSDFKRCAEPWAQSSIVAWIKETAEGEADLKESAIAEALVALFTNKVPTMNTADAEVLSAKFVEQMFEQGALLKDEEWVKFGSTPMNGVIFQLTGTGCYSPKLHDYTEPGRCYSHHCMRTLKKINLQTHMLAPQRKAEDWATFYKLKKADIGNIPKKEIERQNNLHEIVTSEDFFMDQLNVLQVLYRDGLLKSHDPIISPKRLEGFIRDVFGKVDAVKQANEDYLLAQLKYKQEEQGPWIKGFSDIFREWIRRAKAAYIEYAANFPNASFHVRKEAERNMIFRQFLDQMRENEISKRLGWDTYLKAPITRLQRYGLLLQTVHKNMIQDSEEKTNLAIAIEEIRVVTLECDTKVADQSKRTDLLDLSNKLKLRPGMEKVQLNLNHLGREIIFKGDLQRKGSAKVNWLEIHAILFDHYLVLAKPIRQRDAAGGLKHESYDVSKLPIPMDLLVIESMMDDPVMKSTVKGISSVSTVTTKAQPPGLAGTGRNLTTPGGPGPGTLAHTNTGNSTMSNGSGKTLVQTTSLDSPSEKILFPFRVKHLGKVETYVLYAPTAQNRQDWCDKIIEAKTRHAASLYAQNAEPFRLRVMADTAFGYDSTSGIHPRGVIIKGTPLDRAIELCDKSFYGKGARPGPVCRASVNCATAFNQPFGKKMAAVGTDYGVYITEYDDPRSWTKAIAQTHVTQIAVLEDFSLFLVLADKSLIAYHLDAVCPVGANATSENSRKPPQKLSGSRNVDFFTTGRMKDRTLVFYKKRDGISSTFKVLEPVYQKSATSSRSRFGIRKGTTEFFRDFDEFYIPSETYAINLFLTSVAISTAKGIEILTLDKKLPLSIPDLKPPEVASIAARINGQKPLGMFRLNDNEFLLVFEEVGIYVDKHGDVSRAVVMEFVGKAKQAALYANMYLVLVDVTAGFVEVRNAVNGRLRQVVSGRDVKLLDDGAYGSNSFGAGGAPGQVYQPSPGMNAGGTVKIVMQHPEHERQQVVLELIVNEGLKE